MDTSPAESPERASDEYGLGEMSAAQVLHVLSTHHVGRLAFAYESWPVIVPVNFAFDEPTIVIRTAPGAKLTSTPFHATAFEVDDWAADGGWGWSVLAQGPAFDVTEAIDDRSVHLRQLVLEPAAPGPHGHWLTISALRVSGRYFGTLPEGVLVEPESKTASA